MPGYIPPPQRAPGPDVGGNGGSGTHGYSGPVKTAQARFDAHPLRFLQNHPGQVRFYQSYLRNQGYRINVDGRMGPQTAAAALAYGNGKSAQHFNTHNGYANRPPARPAARGGSAAPSNGGGGARRAGPGSGGKGSGRGAGGGGRKGGGGGGRSGGGGNGLINPKKYAKNLTNLQYGPVIDALNQQIAQAQAQGAQNVADLTNRYGAASDTAKSGTLADVAAAQAAVSGQDASNQSLIQALGGGANQGAAPASVFGESFSNLLAGLGQNIHGADTQRQTLVGQEGAQAVNNQQLATSQQVNNLNAQMNQTLAQRKLDLAKNISDAFNQRMQQEAALQSMALSGQQGALQMALGKQQLKSAKIQNRQAQQGLGNGGNNFKWNDANSRQNLADDIRSRVWPSSANGNKYMSPYNAWGQMAGIVRQATGESPVNNKQAFNMVQSLWNEYVRALKTAHPGYPVREDPHTHTPFSVKQWRAKGSKLF